MKNFMFTPFRRPVHLVFSLIGQFFGKHVRLLHGMHAFLLFSFFPLALIGHHLLDESHSFIDGEGKKCSSYSSIYMPLRHGHKPLIEVLEHEPIFSILWCRQDWV